MSRLLFLSPGTSVSSHFNTHSTNLITIASNISFEHLYFLTFTMKTSTSIIAILSAATAAKALPGPDAILNAITARFDSAPVAGNAELVARGDDQGKGRTGDDVIYYEDDDDDDEDDDDEYDDYYGDDDDDEDDDGHAAWWRAQSSEDDHGHGRGRGRGGKDCQTTSFVPIPLPTPTSTFPPFIPTPSGTSNGTLNGTDIFNGTATSSIVVLPTESLPVDDNGGNSNGDDDDNPSVVARAFEILGSLF
ncbi:hypothetical protein F5X68DRAFT_230076 [Plectosphaerella plurivora]|uniref:Uncharacterized protein n=1 Tax=Plectosphaerella plurivora TaxID=936078 RepID=A0A9P8VEQ5_9PEZI|nr:hypothetical protein F5X68DRAFT_230076 [Plectosphaerella plurivora]